MLPKLFTQLFQSSMTSIAWFFRAELVWLKRTKLCRACQKIAILEWITCVSLVETAAEKWVGLTRRIATIKHWAYYNDPALIRHLYDLLKIRRSIELNEDFTKLVKQIIAIEKEQFKTHNRDYFQNPSREIKIAVEFLASSQEWRDNWKRFVHDMVFETSPPTYDEALNSFRELSFLCLG